MNFKITSDSPDKTEAIARSISSKFRGGEVIELISELGGGKTTFTHGLAAGIKSEDNVASPTFTISRVYQGEKLKIHHFDFYRLNDDELIKHELRDVLNDKTNVVVVEWPNLVSDALPKQRLTVEFEYIVDNSRNLLFTYPESLSYLIGNDVNPSS